MNNGKGNPHERQKLEQSNIFYFSQDKKSLYEENQNNPDRFLKNWLRDYQKPIKTRTEKKLSTQRWTQIKLLILLFQAQNAEVPCAVKRGLFHKMIFC